MQWKWELSPQTFLSGVNLIVISVGVISYFSTKGADIEVSKQQLAELRTVVQTLQSAQASQANLLAETKTKVDIILPLVQKIEDQQRAVRRNR
jgi:hypothetical protein